MSYPLIKEPVTTIYSDINSISVKNKPGDKFQTASGAVVQFVVGRGGTAVVGKGVRQASAPGEVTVSYDGTASNCAGMALGAFVSGGAGYILLQGRTVGTIQKSAGTTDNIRLAFNAIDGTFKGTNGVANEGVYGFLISNTSDQAIINAPGV